MKAVEDTIAALGTPVLLRALGAPSAPMASIARWRHGAAIVTVMPSDTIRLAMSLVEGRNARTRGGAMPVAQAPGACVSVFSPLEGACIEVSGEADVVQLFIDQAAIQAMLDSQFVCPPMFDLRDGCMRTMIVRILVNSARRGPDESLKIESDLLALAARLEEHASERRNSSKSPSVPLRGGLAPAVFRRIEAMITTALDEAASLSLAEMAGAGRLSVVHFVRAFRQHTGTTPHQHLVRRRMERALSLLRGANISIGAVAEEVGFSTPAHFVATFRAAMGVTPGAVRNALSG